MQIAKRSILCVVLAVFITHAFSTLSSAAAGNWFGVRSKNFLVLGHLSEYELCSLAASLEEFRAVFSQLLPEQYFDSHAPIVVLIFADDDEYAPFKPLHQGRPDPLVAGYFKSGPDLDYIMLSAGGTRQETTITCASSSFGAVVNVGGRPGDLRRGAPFVP